MEKNLSADNYFMELALKQAQKSYKENEVPVGAVIVYKKMPFAYGRNQRIKKNSSIAHAEIIAIEKASKKLGDWRLNDMTLYVTVEPCLMCVGAIIHSRIKRVVYGCNEPKMGAIESVYKLLDFDGIHHKPEYSSGILADKCKNIISSFFTKLRNKE